MRVQGETVDDENAVVVVVVVVVVFSSLLWRGGQARKFNVQRN